MTTITVTFPSQEPPGKILKLKIRKDTMVATGRILLLYQNATPTKNVKEPEKKLRATNFGRVKQVLVNEGAVVQPGQVIILLEGCTHPTVMADLCAECGVDLRSQASSNTVEVSHASVPMVHSIPELKVCPELAEKIGKEDEQRLLNDRKLVLLVDLDQTIVHTTNDNIPDNMKDVYHFQLYGSNSQWYHTRLRPNTQHFLTEMSRLYELHICTFGARYYAHTVASLLDKDGVLFSHRILSRDECFDPASKTANLKALFPCGDDMVCIIDDREDVWQGCGNLVQVKPYHFFRHTSDINAPPGLEKDNSSRLADKPYLDDLQNKDNKNSMSESVNEIKQLSSDDLAKETDSEKNEEDEKNKKSDTESKEIKKENNKESAKEDANSSDAQSDKNKNDKTDKEEMIVVPSEEKKKEDSKKEAENNIIDEDDDDYLLYLEDILRRIHTEFYAILDQGKERKSLRNIIPRVRSQVLKGLCLTFSGLIPTHQKLHQSRAYKVARAFGAEVIQNLTEKTTHLVAIRKGTAKVNAARKDVNIKVVNSEWLWTCAERWEHVDERLFPLTSQARGSRVPPPHCSSPEHIEDIDNDSIDSFMKSINPLMKFNALTPEDIKDMAKEVNEDMDDQDMIPDEAESIDEVKECNAKRYRISDSSEDSMNGMSQPKKMKINNDINESSSENKSENHSIDDNDDNEKFDNEEEALSQREKKLDQSINLDILENSDDCSDDDCELFALGAALEKKFLSE